MNKYKKDNVKVLIELLIVWLISFVILSGINYILMSIVSNSFIVWQWEDINRVSLSFFELVVMILGCAVSGGYYDYMYKGKL